MNAMGPGDPPKIEFQVSSGRRSMHPDPSELRTLPLFASLGDEDLDQIAKWFEVRSVESGRKVTLEGASGYSFFVIQEGTAVVSRGGDVIRTLESGDFFGEKAILDSGRRTADVVATTPMKLVAMFGADFRQLQAEFPDVANRIQSIVEQR
jgi:CRP-like cAMP-binding protein